MRFREQLKARKKVAREFVPVPEWAPEDWRPTEARPVFGLWVRDVGGDGRDAWEGSNTVVSADGKSQKPNYRGMRTRLVVMACVEEDGTPVFEPADAAWLGQQSAAVLERLYDAACKLAGIRADAEKNSPPPSGSTADSP